MVSLHGFEGLGLGFILQGCSRGWGLGAGLLWGRFMGPVFVAALYGWII